MGLKTYKSKRDFSRTREPAGAAQLSAGRSFVVQKHHASHLHYDFRLELDGVLKSWAVPKGPSLDPHVKRLAVEVEDHPVSYRDFEGTIPKGEYGGGEVLVWDRGSWKPKTTHPLKDLIAGRIEFSLKGEKLAGSWILLRTRKKRQWLLIKRTDQAAIDSKHLDILESRPESVLSGRKIIRKPKSKAALTPPKFVTPQLATLAEKPPEGRNWIHEIKYDGYRTICVLEKGHASLFARSGQDWSQKYGSLKRSCEKLQIKSAVLDGEIVCIDTNGRTDFHSLQTALKAGDTDRLIYYVFDLLHCDGHDLMGQPLTERKEVLENLLRDSKSDRLVYSQHWDNRGQTLFAETCRLGLEGIISKQADAHYVSGRTESWIKSKCVLDQEFVIIGYTQPKGQRSSLGALLLATNDGTGKLRYVGRVGTGFSAVELRELKTKLSKIEVDSPPFSKPKDVSGIWVKPQLLAQVQFAEWTADGLLRHPSYRGLREDKFAAEVVRETPLGKSNSAKFSARAKLSHPERLVFKGVTKLQLATYYESASKLMLPVIKNRPLSILRCPDGIHGKCFFQKHMNQKGVKTTGIRVKERTEKSVAEIFYFDTASDLVSLVQNGAVEFHVWGCRREAIERPDVVVFDLDPDPTVEWAKVTDAAHAIRELLRKLKLKSFLKVTGSKGLHLHVPILPIYRWDQVKAFSKAIARNLEQEHPDLYTTNILKKNRKGKIFLDYLRNDFGSTSVAPYSVRAKEGAPVALPVAWSELDRNLRPDQFRLADGDQFLRRNNPWKQLESHRQRIELIEDIEP